MVYVITHGDDGLHAYCLYTLLPGVYWVVCCGWSYFVWFGLLDAGTTHLLAFQTFSFLGWAVCFSVLHFLWSSCSLPGKRRIIHGMGQKLGDTLLSRCYAVSCCLVRYRPAGWFAVQLHMVTGAVRLGSLLACSCRQLLLNTSHTWFGGSRVYLLHKLR